MRGFVCNATKIGRTKQENLCCLFIENQWLHSKGFWGLFFSSIVSMGCLKQGFTHTISPFLDSLAGEAEWMLNQERLLSPFKWSGGILTFCWPGDLYSETLNKSCESDSPPQLPYKCARYHFKMLCVGGGQTTFISHCWLHYSGGNILETDNSEFVGNVHRGFFFK